MLGDWCLMTCLGGRDFNASMSNMREYDPLLLLLLLSE